MTLNNKDKFLKLVSEHDDTTLEQINWRQENKARLKESQSIALKVLTKLDEIGWSQRKLATVMGVSPQQITKIVKGSENMTLETLLKLQSILEIPILATYYEGGNRKNSKLIKPNSKVVK